MGKQWKQWHTLFLGGSKITADGDCSHEIKRHLVLGKKVMTNLDSILKSRDITLPTKVSPVKAMFFSSSHVWMWELDCKESWAPKIWFLWIVVLVKTLESPLDCKGIQQVHSKGNHSWIFIGRTDAEADTPVLWPLDAKNWLIGKTLMLGKIEGRRKREWQRMRWLDGITISMDTSLSKLQEMMGQGSLAYWNPLGHKESDTTEQLNNNRKWILPIPLAPGLGCNG